MVIPLDVFAAYFVFLYMEFCRFTTVYVNSLVDWLTVPGRWPKVMEVYGECSVHILPISEN